MISGKNPDKKTGKQEQDKTEVVPFNFKQTALTNAVMGGAAGLLASRLGGFMEGTQGGVVAGISIAIFAFILDKLFSLHANKRLAVASGLAMLADYGVHYGRENAVVPYLDEGILPQHIIFYAIMLTLIVSYANRDRSFTVNGLFGRNNDNNSNSAAVSQVKAPEFK